MSRSGSISATSGTAGSSKHAHHVGQRVDLAQVADVGGFLERVLPDRADVDVFHGGVRQLLRVVERGQAIEAVVRNLGDADVRLARIRVACAERCALVRIWNSDVLPTWGRPMMPVFIRRLLAVSSWLLAHYFAELRTGLTVCLSERQTTVQDKR